mmetsp:Transcript_11437/g.25481  ORF Transcript_11437/g.25481 Transcript_11437/m.25481 type:complete len:80 (+) Transcript_11437:342-581(+)
MFCSNVNVTPSPKWVKFFVYSTGMHLDAFDVATATKGVTARPSTRRPTATLVGMVWILLLNYHMHSAGDICHLVLDLVT